jgi:hypothetical protein
MRQSWVYPADGSDPVKKEDYYAPVAPGGITVLPDLPDFVSPVDGKYYSGRAGMREHCARNNVVPTADLKGLPLQKWDTDMRSSSEKKQSAEHRKQVLIQQVNKHYR